MSGREHPKAPAAATAAAMPRTFRAEVWSRSWRRRVRRGRCCGLLLMRLRHGKEWVDCEHGTSRGAWHIVQRSRTIRKLQRTDLRGFIKSKNLPSVASATSGDWLEASCVRLLQYILQRRGLCKHPKGARQLRRHGRCRKWIRARLWLHSAGNDETCMRRHCEQDASAGELLIALAVLGMNKFAKIF